MRCCLSGTLLEKCDLLGAHDQLLLIERGLQLLPVAGPPGAVELLDHHFEDHDLVVLNLAIAAVVWHDRQAGSLICSGRAR